MKLTIHELLELSFFVGMMLIPLAMMIDFILCLQGFYNYPKTFEILNYKLF